MAISSRYMTGKPRRVNIALDSDTLRDLDQIAPDNIGEAVRFCVQFALDAGAVFKATTQHTAAQCRKHQQRYPSNAAPLPTTYGGHVMTARPAPVEPTSEPIQRAAQVAPAAWTPPAQVGEATPSTLEEYLLYGDDEDDTPAQVAPEPLVIRGQPLSAAALAAVAAVALTDEEIRALDPGRGGARPFVG